MGSGLKDTDLHTLLPKKPSSWQCLGSCGSSTMSPGLRDVHPPLRLLSGPASVLPRGTHGHDSSYRSKDHSLAHLPRGKEEGRADKALPPPAHLLLEKTILLRTPGVLGAWPELLSWPVLSGRRLGVSIWYQRPRYPHVTGGSHQVP